MKKVLLAGAALMLVSGIASTASAAEIKPGVVITGDSRVRVYYLSEEYKNTYGNYNTGAYLTNPILPRQSTTRAQGINYSDQTNMDSRVRLNFTGTAAGGAFAKARIRMYEGQMGDMDTDIGQINAVNQNNIWVDIAYMGIPFGDNYTLELGKFRDTWGPLPTTYNFFYDDVIETGGHMIIKAGNLTVVPTVIWMDESQNNYITTGSGQVFPLANDTVKDNDEIRYMVGAKYTINKDWMVGGMVGYQQDDRDEFNAAQMLALYGTRYPYGIQANTGGFGSIFTKGKAGAFGVVGELAVTAADMNGMNNWREDGNVSYTNTYGGTVNWLQDQIGSNDTGFGGYVIPSFTIDKLTLSLNAGFTSGGFIPDRAFGFVMIGSTDNSVISNVQIGSTGDWYWAGLVADYQVNESLKLTANLVYASIDAWTSTGDGPGFVSAFDSGLTNATRTNVVALDSAWEISGVLQYTISKGMNVFLSAGYLMPDLEYVNYSPYYRNPTGFSAGSSLNDDGAFGAAARFELAF